MIWMNLDIMNIVKLTVIFRMFLGINLIMTWNVIYWIILWDACTIFWWIYIAVIFLITCLTGWRNTTTVGAFLNLFGIIGFQFEFQIFHIVLEVATQFNLFLERSINSKISSVSKSVLLNPENSFIVTEYIWSDV